MRGSAIVLVGGQPVYAVVVEHQQGVRLCVCTAEWETTGLFAGQVVEVRVAGKAGRSFLLSDVAMMDAGPGGSTWINFVPPVVAGSGKRRTPGIARGKVDMPF